MRMICAAQLTGPVASLDSRDLLLQVFEQMPGDDLAFLRAELAFFDNVTGISGALYKVPKDERKAAAVSKAREVRSKS